MAEHQQGVADARIEACAGRADCCGTQPPCLVPGGVGPGASVAVVAARTSWPFAAPRRGVCHPPAAPAHGAIRS